MHGSNELAYTTTLERTLVVRAATQALLLEAAARRGCVAARGLVVHDAAQRLVDRRDELVPLVGWGGAPVVVALRIVVPVVLTFLAVVVRSDEEHVADAAAERDDLGAASARAMSGMRPARSSQHSDARTTGRPSPPSAASTASSSASVGRWRNCCCCDAEASSRSATSSTADVCRFSSLTCSITSASRDALSVCTKHKNGFRAMASSLAA
jgi:hypothetical protein